jgi:hypothetical protein
MAEFTGRDLHLVKKALAIAALAIDEQPGPFQSGSDLRDMKVPLDEDIENDAELAYARVARIAATGAPTEIRLYAKAATRFCVSAHFRL